MTMNSSDMNRIVIIGASGSGKSTLARKLSIKLPITYIDMDALFWSPNWTLKSREEMRAIVDTHASAEGHWVTDGVFLNTSDITWPRADTIIWLDYALPFVLWRLFCRTTWRIWSRQRVCGNNVEGWRALFSWSEDENMMLMCFMQYWRIKKRFPVLRGEYKEGRKVLVFKKESECDAWLEELGAGGKRDE